ncbi:hypothetical protein RA19_18565 [Leisingera sp. ANG-M1]|uniref:TetR/AcrR family transcriptional regulator n=1 Tax=Leisingera sp. ANG-M1 TaxID=1577895 RepID=UPI00057D57B2|nr:TetR/AcrR family transcriptional regulator [Leisingera sp. ANG-M1]KIC08857.1 hypothetical protein RA19_18565 [Leisingera sp. ANG-M1]
MRSSKRALILDAIVDLIEEGGIKAITYDAVSEKTQITRGGLLYHFPSRDDLVYAVHEQISERWNQTMVDALENASHPPSAEEKTLAYAKGATTANRVEMLLLMESAMDEAVQKLWQDVLDRWAPDMPDPQDDKAMALFLVRLAADGLWVSEALSSKPLPKAVKDGVLQRLEKMVSEISD